MNHVGPTEIYSFNTPVTVLLDMQSPFQFLTRPGPLWSLLPRSGGNQQSVLSGHQLSV